MKTKKFSKLVKDSIKIKDLSKIKGGVSDPVHPDCHSRIIVNTCGDSVCLDGLTQGV